MSNNVEITAVYLGERIRFPNASGDTIVSSAKLEAGELPERCDGNIGLKGPDGGFVNHMSYRFYGYWSTYQNKYSHKTENQFVYTSFVESQPAGKAGIVAYLERCGKGFGLGRQRSLKLFEKFGTNAVEICRTDPDTAATAIVGWSTEEAQALAEQLWTKFKIESSMIELTELLSRRGFPRSTAQSAIEKWGPSAAQRIRHNPYLLMEFSGCGFLRTDSMYVDLGHNPSRLKRQSLCAWNTINSSTHGHTWFPLSMVESGIRENVTANLRIPQAIELAQRANLLTVEGQFVALANRAHAEAEVAKIAASSLSQSPHWPNASSLPGLSPHQSEHLNKALAGRIGCFGGSPGTGKTYCAAVLIKAIAAEVGALKIAVAAPTGKAAVRITESLANHGIGIQARTIHSLLGVNITSKGFEFLHGPDDPVDFSHIIVDESSMIDTQLMRQLLSAIPDNCQVLFVGDVNQLLPVGHGAPLRDFIGAGLPYGELTEIRRQDSKIDNGIINACASIRQGKQYDTLSTLNEIDVDAGRNLVRLRETNPKSQLDTLLEVLGDCRARGFNPIWHCQPIAAVNEKSPLCRASLNKLLQSELNIENSSKDGFWVGDKIVNTKNGVFPQKDSPKECYVANGELARVSEVHPKYLVAQLETPTRTIKIPRGKSSDESATGCTWELGYALSAHKSQGSEWPVAIVMLDDYPGAKMVCSREWLYTSVSRGKKLVVEIGNDATANRMIGRPAIWDRKTLLREHIAAEKAHAVVDQL